MYDYCVECQEKIKLMYGDENLCHTCGFWNTKVQEYTEAILGDNKLAIIVNGQHYMDEGATSISSNVTEKMFGHSGATFKYKLLVIDKIEITNNMWHQGEIPQHFRDRLPDNAIWIKGE